MALYECVILARQEVSAPQVETLADEMANVIAAGGGQVSKKEYWGLRNLAYRMKKNRKAHYVLMNVDAPSAAVKEMERQMSLNEDVLRYLTIRVDEHEEAPSAVMQSRGDRPERGDRPDRGDRFDRSDRFDRPRREDRPRRSEGGE